LPKKPARQKKDKKFHKTASRNKFQKIKKIWLTG
jgi:hypothetical protein